MTFIFDASSDVIETHRNLPDASTVLITFPISTESGGPTKLVNLYAGSRQSAIQPRFMLLGATGIWEVCVSRSIQVSSLIVRLGSQKAKVRTIQDLEQSRSRSCWIYQPRVQTTALNLAGLWGGSRTGLEKYVGQRMCWRKRYVRILVAFATITI